MSFNSPAAAVGCYSTGEEIANSVTHGVAALLSIAGLVVMLSMMPVTAGAATITAAAVFGASMIFLYTASTLYHAIPNLRVKRILQVLDHSAIYVMIAGSYTPFCLVTLKGTTGTMLCIAVWSIALAGIILQPVLMKRAEWLNCLLYLLLEVLGSIVVRKVWYIRLLGIREAFLELAPVLLDELLKILATVFVWEHQDHVVEPSPSSPCLA